MLLEIQSLFGPHAEHSQETGEKFEKFIYKIRQI